MIKKIGKIIGKIVSYLLAFSIAGGIVFWWFWFYDEIYTQVPEISSEDFSQRPQTTKITDRNGVVLFKIYDEDREYLPHSQISPHLINAITSIEDEHFREHNGIYYKWILRAAINNIFTNNPLQWASTIEQQLVRNLFLTNKKTIKRKLKEAVLTYKLHQYLKNTTHTLKNMSPDDNKYHSIYHNKRERKLKILERYVNYIPFGNNTFGIQAAAKKYFNTHAKNLTILQSSILASLPKGTSLYNPYTNKNMLVGALRISNKKWQILANEEIKQKIITKHLETITKKILNTKRKVSKKWDDNLNYFIKTANTEINYDGKPYHIKYIYGRKDIVLSKMLALGNISQKDYTQAMIEGLTLNFSHQKNTIKAPHFVFYIMQQVKEKRWEELLKRGGLTIKTSLDLWIQRKIRQAIRDNQETLNTYHANNSATITINTQNGDIITYIGSKDFWNTDIQGQNDLIQSKRQLGSILKPLFYAQAFDKLNIWPHTIIPDTPIQIWWQVPRNYDNRFEGYIPVSKALPHSRNIPAIKIFYDLGGEENAKKLFKKLGITSAKEEEIYGYNMVLGGVEMPMYELVTAYRHLSNPNPAIINPILEIRDKNNTILYNKSENNITRDNISENHSHEKSIFTEKTIQDIQNILSTSTNFEKRVKYRVNKYGITFAIKSGTSGMKLSNGEDRSRDGVLVWYDERYVTAIWAGNTDGSPMTADAYGFFLNKKVLQEVQKIFQ